ncbi:hypothetical protein PSFL111601_25645 [Pseudomonas floridensis]
MKSDHAFSATSNESISKVSEWLLSCSQYPPYSLAHSGRIVDLNVVVGLHTLPGESRFSCLIVMEGERMPGSCSFACNGSERFLLV